MNQSPTDTLKVPGATLHYEVCGTGPTLLLIPGGPADAGGCAPIRNVLCDRYTVVTYDPRGLSRSPLDGEPRTRRSIPSRTSCSRHSGPSRHTCSATAAVPWVIY
jgi:pimeloyl-ACP methyl ester carboxylesterase